jgi:hypothetical protein
MPEVNALAVVGAALSSFLLGGLWYSKLLFCDVWSREAGMKAAVDEKTSRHPAKVFGLSAVTALVSAYALGAFLGPDPALGPAVLWGAVAGAGLVGMSFAMNYAFAGRSTKLWLVDAGYHTAQFTLYGLVFGLWP